MMTVYKVMAKIRAKNWFRNDYVRNLTRVDDSTIEVQIPHIKPEGLADLQSMDQANIERIAGTFGDGITIVLEVQ